MLLSIGNNDDSKGDKLIYEFLVSCKMLDRTADWNGNHESYRRQW